MNNEETIVTNSQNGNKHKLVQNANTTEKKSRIIEKKIAMTASAAVMGGIIGSGATYATTEIFQGNEAEVQKPEEEAQATEEHVDAAAEESKKEQQTEAPKEEVAAKFDTEGSEGTDYTGNHGANPVAPTPIVHGAADETSSSNTNEVQVLGVYEAQGENGQTMQAAILTNGEDMAAVVDLDGDGIADVLAVDANHNQQIDEGEVYDLSNNHVEMSAYQDAYLAQQQEQMQQEHETFAYNADEDQSDYNNDVDPSFI